MKNMLDDVDKSILNIIQRNGRVSYSEITKQTGIADATIRFRVNRLVKKGVIRGFSAILNPAMIGFSISGAILLKIDSSNIDDVITKLVNSSETSYIYRSTGEYDVVSVIYARDIGHFNEFVKKVKMLKGVKVVRVSVTTELIKANPTFKL